MIENNFKITRRNFVGKYLGGLTSFLLLGCISTRKLTKEDWASQTPGEFRIKSFFQAYRYNGFYNKTNPNLKRPHRGGATPTFISAVHSAWGATPGVDYNVPVYEVMVAAADGIVLQIIELHTGRPGGMMVTVGHPTDLYSLNEMEGRDYATYYAHLNKVYVKIGQSVSRGEPIGNVTVHNGYAKLMTGRGSHISPRWIDPDNFGENHSYMQYYKNPLELDDQIKKNPETIDNRLSIQTSIVNLLERNRINYEKDPIDSLSHGRKRTTLSIFAKFKILSKLYEIKPELFPGISSDKFNSLKSEFYDNQPIVLTLPLVEGGCRKEG